MPIITISRGSLSGGVRLAERLQARLGYRLLSQDTVVEAAARYGVSAEDVVRGLVLPPNFWERLTHRKDRYILATQATLAEMVEDGNGIYHGLAGQFLLKEVPCVLKVRLIAPMEYRLRAAMDSLQLSREEAEKYIAEVDERRVRWVRQVFGVDWHDPQLYDLVVNLAYMTVDTAADVIVKLLSSEEYRSSSECLQRVRDFALASRIRAELLFSSPFASESVEVGVHQGVVRLDGSGLGERRAEIVELVGRMRGVQRVEVEGVEAEPVPLPSASTFGLRLSSEDRRAGDVMLPPDRYPTVHEWVSLREAVVALAASSVRLEDGFMLHPRYLLVLNREEELVGVVGRRELLKGLSPQYRGAERAERHIRQLVPYGEAPYDLIRWTALFSSSAVDASREQVRSVMAPVRGAVRVDDPLSAVITTMIREGVDLVPVLDDRKVAGLVLMTNVFDLVAEFIMEHGGSAGSP